MTNNASRAVELAAAGIPVFPCDWRGDRAKTPLSGHGFHDATTDADAVSSWWSKNPPALIGVPIPANVVVVDTDEKADADTGEVYTGDETLAKLDLLEAADQTGLIVRTAGGGLHRWFKVEDTDKFSNTSNVNGHTAVDLRVAGKGYVIVPGSSYDLGAYDTVKGDFIAGYFDPIQMPSALVSALRKPDTSQAQIAAEKALAGFDPGSRWVSDHGDRRLSERERKHLEKRLDGLFRSVIDGVSRAGPGTRHKAVYNAARTLAGYTASYAAFGYREIAEALFSASVANGHVEKDGQRMTVLAIEHGIENGRQYPLLLEERQRTGFDFGRAT